MKDLEGFVVLDLCYSENILLECLDSNLYVYIYSFLWITENWNSIECST